MISRLFFPLIALLFASNGAATRLWAGPGVTADPPALDFGGQAEGTFSPSQSLTLINGSGIDQVVGNIFISGQDPQQFQVTEDLCSGLTLADGETCTLSVLFSPRLDFSGGNGPATADLLAPFENSSVLSVPLSGNSLIPQIVPDRTAFDFGTEVAGHLSDPQILTITNSGTSDLFIQDNKVIGPAPADFGLTMDFCSFQTLAPGESCQIAISMRATEIGERTAQFVIESNDPNQPFSFIALSGEGKGSGGCQLIRHRQGLSSDFTAWLFIVGILGLMGLLRLRVKG